MMLSLLFGQLVVDIVIWMQHLYFLEILFVVQKSMFFAICCYLASLHAIEQSLKKYGQMFSLKYI